MSAILTSREKESFKLAANQVFVTVRSKAPKGQTQEFEGQFHRYTIAEKFDSPTLRSIAINEIWSIIEDKIFNETRAEILKEFLAKNPNAKEIPSFSLSLDAVVKALRGEAEAKIGKLSEALITAWAKSSGLEDALISYRLSTLGENPSEAQVEQQAQKVAAAISLLTPLSGSSYKGDLKRLESVKKILSYCPNQEDALYIRLIERIELLSKKEEKQEDVAQDF